jgi:hypothetical protein
MGYRRKIYTLKWAEGHDLHGLEVSLTGLSVGRVAKLEALAGALAGGSATGDMLATADELFREMAACLLEWNLEDHKGNPVPATYEGIADQDITLIADLATSWVETAVSVDTPLPNGSSATPSTALEGSIPMTAALSPSPGN